THRELVVCGPAATTVLRLEDEANANEVLASPPTAASLDPSWLGGERAGARLVTATAAPPDLDPLELPAPVAAGGLDDLTPTPLRIALGRGPAEAEHRHAAVAFVKFTGTDALVADLDEAAARIGELGRAVGDACDAFGVTWLESDIDLDGGKLYLV